MEGDEWKEEADKESLELAREAANLSKPQFPIAQNKPKTKMTPKEIKNLQNEITDSGVEQLAKFLDNWGGIPNKNFVELNVDMMKDKENPARRCRIIFASAYDWFTFGN